jgi:hypothetical protein
MSRRKTVAVPARSGYARAVAIPVEVAPVNREEAERALAVIRKVVQNTRDDLVAHNWGLIWMVHAFTNLAACLAGWYLDSQEPPPRVFWYLVPFAVVGAVDIVIVQLLRKRDQGVRSYVEWQLHGIWCSFVVFTAVGAVALQASGTSPHLFGALFALTSGFSFAMMGVIFSRQWLFALLFLAVAAVAPLLPGVQWGLIGLAWWSAMFFPGLLMHLEKRRRSRDGTSTELL